MASDSEQIHQVPDVHLNGDEIKELIKEARQGADIEALSAKYGVSVEQIGKWVGGSNKTLTRNERTLRNQAIVKEFIANPVKCEQGNLQAFCGELAGEYKLKDAGTVRRIYKKFKKQIKAGTSFTKTDIRVASLENSKKFQEFIDEKEGKILDKTLNAYVGNIRILFNDYTEMFFPEIEGYVDIEDWTYPLIKKLLRFYEREGGIFTDLHRGSINQLHIIDKNPESKFYRKEIHFDRKPKMFTYNPTTWRPKQPLSSEEMRHGISCCPKVFKTDEQALSEIRALLPLAFTKEDLEKIFVREACTDSEFTMTDYVFFEEYKDKPENLCKRFGIDLGNEKDLRKLANDMGSIRNQKSKFWSNYENLVKTRMLESCLRLMVTTGLRKGDVEQSFDITETLKGKDRPHGLEGMKFEDWNMREARWRFSVSEKLKFWMNVLITTDTQKSLMDYFSCLPVEEKSNDSYCFKVSTLGTWMEKLTEIAGIGKFKRILCMRKKQKGRRKSVQFEVPEGTLGGKIEIAKNGRGKSILLEGRKMHPHLLRASFASILYNELNLRLEEIAELGHWGNLQMLWDRYIVTNRERVLENVIKIENLGF